MQALFELDSVGHQPEETIARQFKSGPLSEEVKRFAEELVNGVLSNKDQIDKTIEATAPAFPIDQLAVIDRNILRLAIYEVLIDNRVPVRASDFDLAAQPFPKKLKNTLLDSMTVGNSIEGTGRNCADIVCDVQHLRN